MKTMALLTGIAAGIFIGLMQLLGLLLKIAIEEAGWGFFYMPIAATIIVYAAIILTERKRHYV